MTIIAKLHIKQCQLWSSFPKKYLVLNDDTLYKYKSNETQNRLHIFEVQSDIIVYLEVPKHCSGAAGAPKWISPPNLKFQKLFAFKAVLNHQNWTHFFTSLWVTCKSWATLPLRFLLALFVHLYVQLLHYPSVMSFLLHLQQPSINPIPCFHDSMKHKGKIFFVNFFIGEIVF